MGVSVYPAPSTGGATPQLRATYTTSQAVSFDVPRYCFFILAGGGGGAAGNSGTRSSGGGGAGGVISGKMMLKDFSVSIGVGGAATTSSQGNKGTSSYLVLAGAGTGTNTGRLGNLIIARGGGEGTSALATPGQTGEAFSDGTTPTISGFTSYTRYIGASGGSGGSLGAGANSNANYWPNINSSSYTSYGQFNGWIENYPYNGNNVLNPYDMMTTNQSLTGGAAPIRNFQEQTEASTGVVGGNATTAGGSATRGRDGVWAGAGGGGVEGNQGTSSTNRGGQGGGGSLYQGGMGGVSIGVSGQTGPGGGGGAGICAAGANGGNASASGNGGAGGDGGLGGGGGGGAGGSGSVMSGKGGDGAFVVFY